MTLDVQSNILYELKGAGATKSYSVDAIGSAGFSDAAVPCKGFACLTSAPSLKISGSFLTSWGDSASKKIVDKTPGRSNAVTAQTTDEKKTGKACLF
jgi:hypothetical protein